MIRTLDYGELFEEAIARFGGADPLTWAFRCPRCGDVAAVREFPEGSRHRAGQDCIGRYTPGRGCDWAFTVCSPGLWTVLASDGRALRTFPFADRVERIMEGVVA